MTTLDRYGHLFDGLDDHLADALDEIRGRGSIQPQASNVVALPARN